MAINCSQINAEGTAYLNQQVNIGGTTVGSHHWSGLGSGTSSVSSGAPAYKIRVHCYRPGNVSYFKGFMLDLYAGGKGDWSGHGFVTHASKYLITIYSDTGARVHPIYNVGYSYLQNNSANYAYSGTSTVSTDTNYLYVDLQFSSNESGGGWTPYWDAITYDPNQNHLVRDVTVIN